MTTEQVRLDAFQRPVSDKFEVLRTIKRLFRKWNNVAKLNHSKKKVETLRTQYIDTIKAIEQNEKLGFVAIELVTHPDGSFSINYFTPEERPINSSIQYVTSRDEVRGLEIENNVEHDHPLLIEVRKTYMRSEARYYKYENLAEFAQAIHEVIGYLRDFRFDVIVVDNTKQFTNMQG